MKYLGILFTAGWRQSPGGHGRGDHMTGLTPGTARLLIATLTPTTCPTVIAADGHLRDWGDLPRLDRNRRLENKIRAIITAIRDSGHPVDHQHKERHAGLTRIIADPVIGPSGAVHAIQLWVGALDVQPPPLRPVAAFTWSSNSRLIELSAETNERYVFSPIAGRLTLTSPEAFRHIEHFDDAMTLIGKALQPRPDDHWSGRASIRTPHGLRTVQLAMRSMPAPDHESWRGLIHDVTDAIAPAPPALHSLALFAIAARSPATAAAIMDVGQARIIAWITDPIPGIQWKGVTDDRDTPPPEDMERIFASFGRFKDGATVVHVPEVRLRRVDGGWTTVDGRATLIPTTAGPLMVLVELTPVLEPTGPTPT